MISTTVFLHLLQDITELHLQSSVKTTFLDLLNTMSLPADVSTFAVYEAERLVPADTFVCRRRLSQKEHPVVVMLGWSTLGRNCCFVVRQYTVKSAYLDLRFELVSRMPSLAIQERLEVIRSSEQDDRKMVLDRHQKLLRDIKVRLL